MASDLDKVNTALAEAKRAQEQQRKRQEEEHVKAVQTVQEMIALYDIKPEELGFLPVTVGGKRVNKDGSEDTRHNVAPKYRGPGGETWAGRGVMPKWLIAAIAAGASKEDFSIEAQERKIMQERREESETRL